jgi:hypothetical protein
MKFITANCEDLLVLEDFGNSLEEKPTISGPVSDIEENSPKELINRNWVIATNSEI